MLLLEVVVLEVEDVEVDVLLVVELLPQVAKQGQISDVDSFA